MNLENGKVYHGKVSKIMNFGAFVDIINPENQRDRASGMVHISEISNEYVKDINDILKEGQEVDILVLGMNEKKKYSFSIKQASKTENKPVEKKETHRERVKKEDLKQEDSFEAMMNQFKRVSEDKMCDIKRIRERKNNSRRSK